MSYSYRLSYLFCIFSLFLVLRPDSQQCFGHPSQTQLDDSELECRPSDIQLYSWVGPGLNPGDCWHQGYRFPNGATWGHRDVLTAPFCVCEQGKIRIFYSQHRSVDRPAHADALTLLPPVRSSSPTLKDLEKWPIPNIYHSRQRTFVCTLNRLGRRVRSRDGCIGCKCSKHGHWLCRQPPLIPKRTRTLHNDQSASSGMFQRSNSNTSNEFNVQLRITTSDKQEKCIAGSGLKFCILIERLFNANTAEKSSRYIEVPVGTSWDDQTSCTRCLCTSNGHLSCEFLEETCSRPCLLQKMRPVPVMYYFPSGSKWISPPQDKCRSCICTNGQRRCINCDQILNIEINTPMAFNHDYGQRQSAIGEFRLAPSIQRNVQVHSCLLPLSSSSHQLISPGQRTWLEGRCYFCPQRGGSLLSC